MSKHVSKSHEWDQVVPLVCAAHNFLPNEHSKESPFLLMFCRDSIVALNTLLTPMIRYLGTDWNISRDSKAPTPSCKIKEGDSVLLKGLIADVWDPKYSGVYRIVSLPRKTQVEVADSTGRLKVAHISNVEYVLPADRDIAKLPDYQAFSRQSKLKISPWYPPNLKWEPTVTINVNFSASTFKLNSTSIITNQTMNTPIVSMTLAHTFHPSTGKWYMRIF